MEKIKCQNEKMLYEEYEFQLSVYQPNETKETGLSAG